MNFASDTEAPAHDAVLAAHRSANSGPAGSYGGDDWTVALAERLKAVFETDALAIAMVGSGTASNGLALSLLTPPHGAILCHETAHIQTHERGAPEFFTGGAKLALLPGEHGRIDAAALRAALAMRDPTMVHAAPAFALSLSNLTEAGTAYAADQMAELAGMARKSGLAVHLDGARLANVIAASGAAAADLTWRAGVDVLSLGLTKCGGANAEFVVLFGAMAERLGELDARRKRAGHMPAKARYPAAEALALLDGDLWLQLAGCANASAARLARALASVPEAEILHQVEGNLIFVRLPEPALERARGAGARFHAFGGVARLVCSWNTTDQEIDALAGALKS